MEVSKASVAKGIYWTVAMRWINRLISLISVVILARLLTPEDYGLVAISLVLIGAVQVFFELGVETSLLRSDKTTTEEYNTAWTLRLIQSSLLALVLFAAAPYAANYYEDARLTEIFYLCCVGILIKGFENIGVVIFRKELKFNKDFTFNVSSRIVGTTLTIMLAFYYQSYHALVIGTIAKHLASVVLSYTMISYRPKFTLSEFKSVWLVSKWMVVKNITSYLGKHGDYLIVGKLAPFASLGHYRWTQELNSLTTKELLQPISRVLLPSFANIQSDRKRLYRAYLKSLNYITSLAIPIVLGLGATASIVVPFLLGGGDKWAPVIPLLEAAAFVSFFRVLHSLSNNVLIVLEKIKVTAYIDICKTAFILALIYPAYNHFGMIGLLYTKVIASAFTMFALYYLLIKHSEISVEQIAKEIWRPCTAGLTMYGILINISINSGFLIIDLLAKVALGALIYTLLLFVLWYISGKADSIELAALDKLKAKLNFKSI